MLTAYSLLEEVRRDYSPIISYHILFYFHCWDHAPGAMEQQGE